MPSYEAEYFITMGTEIGAFGGPTREKFRAKDLEEAQERAREIASRNTRYSNTDNRFTNTKWRLVSIRKTRILVKD